MAAIAAAEAGRRYGDAGEGAEMIHQRAFTASRFGPDGDDAAGGGQDSPAASRK